MNFLSQSARVYRHNVGHLCSSHQTTCTTTRSLTTNQWKKYTNILDITKDASSKEIKDSFLKLSKVYHPDNKVTGSHAKFVELKEAYDALKDGKPKITSDTSSYTGARNYYYDTDTSYQAHKAYRDRWRDYPNGQHRYGGFGGPYQHSKNPWDDLMKDREYRRQKQSYESFANRGGRNLVSVTMVLSALAWIVIYSSVLLIWDYNDSQKKNVHLFTSRDNPNYIQYQQFLKKKEAERIATMEKMNNSRYTVTNSPSYITTNDSRHIRSAITVPSTADSTKSMIKELPTQKSTNDTPELVETL